MKCIFHLYPTMPSNTQIHGTPKRGRLSFAITRWANSNFSCIISADFVFRSTLDSISARSSPSPRKLVSRIRSLSLSLALSSLYPALPSTSLYSFITTQHVLREPNDLNGLFSRGGSYVRRTEADCKTNPLVYGAFLTTAVAPSLSLPVLPCPFLIMAGHGRRTIIAP